jgi:hypothetical protein
MIAQQASLKEDLRIEKQNKARAAYHKYRDLETQYQNPVMNVKLKITRFFTVSFGGIN